MGQVAVMGAEGATGARQADGISRGRSQPETIIASFRQVLVQRSNGTARPRVRQTSRWLTREVLSEPLRGEFGEILHLFGHHAERPALPDRIRPTTVHPVDVFW